MRVARSMGVDPATLIDLSMSMNPFAPDVASVVADRVRAIDRYPDPGDAERSLARAIGVSADRLVLTNGGAEAIALVAAQQPVGEVVDPEFSLYRRHLRAIEVGAPRWRSSPSNPLGRLVDRRVDGDADPVGRQGYDVWDEAFYPLATGEWTDPTLHDAAVWRLGSLTKTWSCPGLRLGYAIAPDEESAAAIRLRRPEWSVNALAVSVIEPLLDLTDLAAWAQRIASARSALTDELNRLGFRAEATQANWLLVGDDARSGRDLRSDLLHHRVLVRDCANFGLPSVFRVAVPHPDRMDQVVGAFRAVAAGR